MTEMTARPKSTLALRMARADDIHLLRRLADLDSAQMLTGEILLAIIDDQAVAALSLSDGRVVANPFVPTAEAVALLTLRASQLSAARARRWAARIPRLRLRAA